MAAENQMKIAEGVYWVGDINQKGSLHCNPYLIVDGDEAVLIDPGSILDFEQVYKNIQSIIPIENIKYVILSHQDPDLCSSVPLFEKNGGKFKVVTHWKTQSIVTFYGINSQYYIVDENDYKLTLNSGRELKIILTPYLHFAGSIATYDLQSKILFSSDLFGAVSEEWSLYAKEDYLDKMEVFHEHYMPSNEILRPVMQIFLNMEISMIAPQHGSIIAHDVKKYIRALQDLECGSFLNPIKKNLAESGGYLYICNLVLRRYAAVYGKEEVIDALKDLDVEINNETLEMIDYNYTGSMLGDVLFDHIYAKKGYNWILIIEPLVLRLSKEYGIEIPAAFNTVKKSELLLSRGNKQRSSENNQWNKMLGDAKDKITKDPVTNLYNYGFFKDYLAEGIKENILNYNPVLLAIRVDNMEKIRFSHGEEESNRLLINTATIIKTIKDENTIVFRLQGTEIACYILNATKEEATAFAEKIRNAVAISNAFIERTTVSIGLASLDEIEDKNTDKNFLFEEMNEIALYRLNIAENSGKNLVCSNSDAISTRERKGKVLIVGAGDVNNEAIRTLLENMKIKVFTAKDGEAAIRIAEQEVPNVIVSELILTQKDAFRVRESLLMRSRTKNIDFILISYLKNEDTVARALSLGIDHYIKKPYMLSELVGIVKLKIEGDANR